MCNTYIVRPKRGAKGVAQRINEAAAKLASALVRKSDPGVVVRADGRVEMQQFLAGSGHWDFQPFDGPLLVTPCESPLKKRRDGGTEQQDLF